MWFEISNAAIIDTPALAVYPDRVKENISLLKSFLPETHRLRPHVKTNKSPEVAKLLLEAGIKKFKCATIAEAEMLAMAGAKDILLAYQPTGPKIERFAKLIETFPEIQFSCLTDNQETAVEISNVMQRNKIILPVYIDLNVGMNRTGIPTSDALELYHFLCELEGIQPVGLHAYDGHLRDPDLAVRTQQCDDAYKPVEDLAEKIKAGGNKIVIIAGGTPTFPIHARRKEIECSPGTFIYWDTGYGNLLKEQPYHYAAVVLTRVISKPSPGMLCLDLGHKAIASENPLQNRVTFLNAPELEPTGQSEEHLVVKTDKWDEYHVGQLIYGIPFHICPTVALHDFAWAIEKHEATQIWYNLARTRKLEI